MKNKLKRVGSILTLLLVAVLLSACSILDFGASKSFNVVVSSNIGGDVSGGGIYDKNEKATLTATPETGYVFYGWLNHSEELISNTAVLKLVVKQDTTLKAKFLRDNTERFTFNYQIKTDNLISNEGGSVSQSFDVALDLVNNAKNKIVVLDAEPNQGYIFVGWERNSQIVGTNQQFDYTLTSSATITAKFAKVINNSPEGLIGRSFARIDEDNSEINIYVIYFETASDMWVTNYFRNYHSLQRINYEISDNVLTMTDGIIFEEQNITISGGKITIGAELETLVFFEFSKNTLMDAEYYLYDYSDSNEGSLEIWKFRENGNIDIVHHQYDETRDKYSTEEVKAEYFVYNNFLVVYTEYESYYVGRYSLKANSMIVDSKEMFKSNANIEGAYYLYNTSRNDYDGSAENYLYEYTFTLGGDIIATGWKYSDNEVSSESDSAKYVLLDNQMIILMYSDNELLNLAAGDILIYNDRLVMNDGNTILYKQVSNSDIAGTYYVYDIYKNDYENYTENYFYEYIFTLDGNINTTDWRYSDDEVSFGTDSVKYILFNNQIVVMMYSDDELSSFDANDILIYSNRIVLDDGDFIMYKQSPNISGIYQNNEAPDTLSTFTINGDLIVTDLLTDEEMNFKYYIVDGHLISMLYLEGEVVLLDIKTILIQSTKIIVGDAVLTKIG